jgi:ABC-type sugar transport system ATPase subunit
MRGRDVARRNLDVFYGDLQALDGVSLEVEEGAIVAIVGANGPARPRSSVRSPACSGRCGAG